MQHSNVAGPGHWFVSVLPLAQEEVKRQLPLLAVPHEVLVQHLMSSGWSGHYTGGRYQQVFESREECGTEGRRIAKG